MITIWQQPVTNRTEQDIISVKQLKSTILVNGWDSLSETQQKLFLGDMIGTMNYVALNRIEINTQVMSELLDFLGFIVPTLQYKVTWQISDLPVTADFDKILSNLRSLIAVSYPVNTQVPLNLNSPTIYQVNDVEKVLLEMYEATVCIIANFKYCGTLACDEKIVLPQRRKQYDR